MFLVLLIGPLVIPVPAARGTLPVAELARAESNFIEVGEYDVHFTEAGSGDTNFLLLHGLGANAFSWRPVTATLAEVGTVIAFDRPGFGLTERPLSWEGENPYSLAGQVELALALLDKLELDSAILVAHSAGAQVALSLALEHPERVEGLVLVAPTVDTAGAPGWLRPLLNLPQIRRLGPLLVQALAPDNGVPEPGIEAAADDFGMLGATAEDADVPSVSAENWDRGLWEYTLASKEHDLAHRLTDLAVPVLVVAGDQDEVVPPEASICLAHELDANLIVLQGIGHQPHAEDPATFVEAVLRWGGFGE